MSLLANLRSRGLIVVLWAGVAALVPMSTATVADYFSVAQHRDELTALLDEGGDDLTEPPAELREYVAQMDPIMRAAFYWTARAHARCDDSDLHKAMRAVHRNWNEGVT